MATQEMKTPGRETDVGEAAITMAIGIVIERVSRLSDADKSDVFELMKGLTTVQDAEEFESIRDAMIEILDQERITGKAMDLNDPARSERAEKWAKHVGKKVKEFRDAKGLTQQQLEKASGLPQSHISRIERGEISPSHLTVEKLAQALGVEVNAIDPTRE